MRSCAAGEARLPLERLRDHGSLKYRFQPA
jgi:hypothetical protein